MFTELDTSLFSEKQPFFRGIDISAPDTTIPYWIKRIVTEKAERWLAYEFPEITVTRYMETRRYGNRHNHEMMLIERWMALFDLICGELLYRNGRYIDKIMDCVWMDCELSTWTIQSHVPYQLPTVDG